MFHVIYGSLQLTETCDHSCFASALFLALSNPKPGHKIITDVPKRRDVRLMCWQIVKAVMNTAYPWQRHRCNPKTFQRIKMDTKYVWEHTNKCMTGWKTCSRLLGPNNFIMACIRSSEMVGYENIHCTHSAWIHRSFDRNIFNMRLNYLLDCSRTDDKKYLRPERERYMGHSKGNLRACYRGNTFDRYPDYITKLEVGGSWWAS